MGARRLVTALALAAFVATPAYAGGGGEGDPGIHCKPTWAAVNDPGDSPMPTIYVPDGMECYAAGAAGAAGPEVPPPPDLSPDPIPFPTCRVVWYPSTFDHNIPYVPPPPGTPMVECYGG